WDTTTGVSLGSFVTTASGSGAVPVKIPEAVKGAHSIIAKGQASALQATTAFTVVPTLALNKSSAGAGTYIAAALRGFGATDTPTATPTTLSTQTATLLGSVTVNVVVPQGAMGTHKLAASGAGGSLVSLNYTIVPSVMVSPTSGTVGTSIVITLRGYQASEPV